MTEQGAPTAEIRHRKRDVAPLLAAAAVWLVLTVCFAALILWGARSDLQMDLEPERSVGRILEKKCGDAPVVVVNFHSAGRSYRSTLPASKCSALEIPKDIWIYLQKGRPETATLLEPRSIRDILTEALAVSAWMAFGFVVTTFVVAKCWQKQMATGKWPAGWRV